MSTVVLSIGGSVLVPEEPDLNYIKAVAATLKQIARKHNCYVVVGGGRTARKYIEAARALGADEFYLDMLGIEITRINAMLLIAALDGTSNRTPAKTIEECVSGTKHGRIAVMGGTHPGHTTDGVAAMLAERVRADLLVNMTSVDGVYTADPKKDKNAKKLERLTPQKLLEIVSVTSSTAGSSTVLDLLAAKIIARSDIPTFVINGTDLDSLKNVLAKRKFNGSAILP